MGVTVSPGGCGGQSWGALYKDSQGNLQGVTKLSLKGGDAGKSKVKLKG